MWAEAKSSLHPIRAESRALVGYVDAEVHNGRLDMRIAPTGHVELEVESMKSGNHLFDLEVERRLDARKYPLVEGEVRSVTEIGAGSGRYQVQGDVAFHGVTRSLTGQVTLEAIDGAVLQIEGAVTLDMRDFDLTPPNYVDPMFKVSVRVVVEQER
jgi:polyisoprenoid-binding protein YceI